MSQRLAEELFEGVLCVEVVLGTVVNLHAEAAEALEAPYVSRTPSSTAA